MPPKARQILRGFRDFVGRSQRTKGASIAEKRTFDVQAEPPRTVSDPWTAMFTLVNASKPHDKSSFTRVFYPGLHETQIYTGDLFDLPSYDAPLLVSFDHLAAVGGWSFDALAEHGHLLFLDTCNSESNWVPDEGRWALICQEGWQSWILPHDVANTGFSPQLDEAALTNPAAMLEAFGSATSSGQEVRNLALFAETLTFDGSQRARLLEYLWAFVVENRTSRDKGELIALGAAIRKLLAYLPIERFEEIPAILEEKAGMVVLPNIELDMTKGLVYRLSWDVAATTAKCPHLHDALHDLATFHSSRRVLGEEFSSAIAANALIALSSFNDSMVAGLMESLSKRSQPWFMALVSTRAKRLVNRLGGQPGRNLDALRTLAALRQSDITTEGR